MGRTRFSVAFQAVAGRLPCVATPETSAWPLDGRDEQLCRLITLGSLHLLLIHSISKDSQSCWAVPGTELGKVEQVPTAMKEEACHETWVAL